MAGSSVEPDSALLAKLHRLYFLFAFYHGSVDQVELVSLKCLKVLHKVMKNMKPCEILGFNVDSDLCDTLCTSHLRNVTMIEQSLFQKFV